MTQSLLLASASTSRAQMLRSAGVLLEVSQVRVDEKSVRDAMLAEGASARDIADTLAEMKARRGADRNPGRLVLGADQVLICDGRMIEKAANTAEAAETLKLLRGHEHRLFSAAVIFENGAPIWRFVGTARLNMRSFTDAFLQGYIERNGDAILHSVGCYHLEGEGAQLFSRVEGDFFTILGLPLLEVLAFLRTRGVLVE